MLFAALEARSELRYWLKFGGEATIRSYPYVGAERVIDPEHVRFLKANARDYFETDEFIFVHASYEPNKPMGDASFETPTLQWETIQPGVACAAPCSRARSSLQATRLKRAEYHWTSDS